MLNFQGWLDRVAQTFFDDDFDTYAGSIEQPFVLMTTTRTLIASTTEDLRDGFVQFRHMLLSQGATDFIRVAEDVRMLGPTLLTGSYETHILRNGLRLFDPYRSAMTLRLGDGVWRAAAITNAMSNDRWPIHLPRIDGSAFGGGAG